MKISVLVLVVVLTCSCLPQQNKSLKNADWLIGTWENRTPGGIIYESWTRIHKDTLSGKSYALRDKDTLVFETILMVLEGNNIFYIPVVPNQNGGRAVPFKAKTISCDELIFENPDHDFPQLISYSKKGKDSLVAKISGVINGNERSQQFPMKRKTKN